MRGLVHSYILLLLGAAIVAVGFGCARPIPVRSAHFRSARVKMEGPDCVADGLRKNTFPTKLASVAITRSSSYKYRVTGRLMSVGDEMPVADAAVIVVNPAGTGECLYHTGQKLGTTNFKGEFDFHFTPEPRQEILLHKEGYNPQILKLPVKVVRQVVKKK